MFGITYAGVRLIRETNFVRDRTATPVSECGVHEDEEKKWFRCPLCDAEVDFSVSAAESIVRSGGAGAVSREENPQIAQK